MRPLAIAVGLFVLMPGCGERAGGDDGPGRALEQAAIDRGLIPGEDAIIFSGRYEQRSDIGTDKFCAVESGGDHDIGAFATFGPQSYCEARGTARRDGEEFAITLKGKSDCRFTARFDGIELVFPGSLPAGCAEHCTGRASFSGVSFYFVEGGDAAARSSTGQGLDRLCE